MSRIELVALATLVLLADACANESRSSTTTVTAGSIAGGPIASSRARGDAAARLAGEICAREAACNHIRDGARYRTEEACMAEQAALAPPQLARWGCVPRNTQAGFEVCLAAVRSERCETALPRADVLVACRHAQVCAANHD